MSTRSAIVRITGEHSFEGRYHHRDGFPTALGATLFNLYNNQFKKDLPKMLHVLIDEHPAGWSTINGCDFSQKPGYNEIRRTDCTICGKPDDEHFSQGEHYLGHAPQSELIESDRPHCYCHGDRHQQEQLITEKNAADWSCEYLYLFTEGRQMLVLSSYCENGDKMIGMFGCGDPDASWKAIGIVDLDAPEPDWEAIEAKSQTTPPPTQ